MKVRDLVLILIGLLSANGAMSAKPPGLLRVGIPEGLPGYTMHANGTLEIGTPFKKRITECIEKSLNARFSWEAYPTNRVLHMLSLGTLDLAYPMGFTGERAAQFLQSQFTWANPDFFISLHPIDFGDKTLRIAARLGSPQYSDYLADGYKAVVGTYTYTELVKQLTGGLSDAVIVPRSVYEELLSNWPKDLIITEGRARNTGFYLNKSDPKNQLGRLNRAIERCRENEKQAERPA
jgi:ABC-type amino acid transport substrate-binding protein